MFRLFKKKDSDKDRLKAAIRQEFDTMIAVARVAPISKQARVGKGVNDALAAFDRDYTNKIFQELTVPERMVLIEALAKRQDELRLMDGDVSAEHIGYSLVSRWVIAVAMGNNKLVKYFDENMAYFKRATQTL
jgi:hypothetical protein